MIYEKLDSYLREVYTDELYTSRISIHEALKAQLYVFGFREKLLPILEADVKIGRIDCLLLRGKKPICAIEIDYSIKQRSIEKLRLLPRDTEKIILSYCSANSTYRRALSRHKGDLDDIRIFRYRGNRRY